MWWLRDILSLMGNKHWTSRLQLVTSLTAVAAKDLGHREAN